MKLRKLSIIWLMVVLLAVPVFAQTLGSLELLNVQGEAVLYRVADQNGVAAAEFSVRLETKLTQDTLTPELARTLSVFAKTNGITGQSAVADGEKRIRYEALEQGYYLVCSTEQEALFAPFLVCIPMTIGDTSIYDIQAQPKTETPEQTVPPTQPEQPKPNIPQTGYIQWPKYLLLALGGVAIIAGAVEILRGRGKQYE